MATALRPMSTGEVLDRTFNLYRSHFPLFAGIATILSLMIVLGSLISILLTYYFPAANFDPQNPSSIIWFIGTWVVGLLLFYLTGYALASGATIYAVSQVHLSNPATIRGSYRRIYPRLWSITVIVLRVFVRCMGALLLPYLLMFVTFLKIGPPIARSLIVSGGSLAAFRVILVVLLLGSFLGGLIWSIRLYCRYSLAVPACLLEKLPSGDAVKAGPAIKRSANLAKGALFRVFVVILLVTILDFAFTFALQYPATFIGNQDSYLVIGWNLLVTFIASTLVFPISTIAISLIYYDQRIRKEAFDLQLMIEAVGQAQTLQHQNIAAAPGIG